MPGPGDRGGPRARPRDAKGALRRILQYLMEYRWWVLLFLICTFLSNIGNLLGPQFAGEAIGVVEEGCRLGPGHVDMSAVCPANAGLLRGRQRHELSGERWHDAGGPPGGPKYAPGRVQ